MTSKNSSGLKSPAARGHLGGIKGGPARAKKLSPEKREEIARIGGNAKAAKGK